MNFIGIVLAWNLTTSPLCPDTWMERQIERELQAYSNSITKASIERSYTKIRTCINGEALPIVRVQFSNGNPKWIGESIYSKQATAFCNALSLLHELQPLPDLDLLLCLSPSFEKPLYCRLTTVPIFVCNKSRNNSKLVMIPDGVFHPDREIYFKKLSKNTSRIPWADRKLVALWHPKTIPQEYLYTDLDTLPSIRFLLLGKRYPEQLNIHLEKDASFKKIPWQVRSLFLKLGLADPPLSLDNQVTYRYLIACEQMGMLPDLEWKLFSGSVLLKTPSALQNWYLAQLKPLVHYLPIHLNGEDLLERLEWAKDHDEGLQAMAAKAQLFAQTTLSDQKMLAYFDTLLRKYANCLLN